MPEQSSQIRIKKLRFPSATLDNALLSAFATLEEQDPQLGRLWLENLARHALDVNEEAVVFVASLSAENFVALPMRLTSHGEGHALATFYTSTWSPVINSPAAAPLFSALFAYLLRTEKLDSITLSPLFADSRLPGDLQAAMQQSGWHGIHRYFCFGNWVHDLQGDSYASYLASRPSKVRNTVKRRARKFLADDRGQLELINDGASLDNAIVEFVQVYNSSWKQPEPFPEFIPSLLRLAAERGWLRLGIARYDGQAVAGQFWLVAGDTAYIFKLAYHEKYRELSPGTVLTAFMMEQVIDRDGIRNIDYLSGDDTYKQDWMSLRCERHGIAAYNPRTSRGLAMLLGHALKNAIKKIRA